MNPKTEALLAALRACMPAMSDEERVELASELMDGYCQSCGSAKEDE